MPITKSENTNVRIIGTGSYLPTRKVTNSDLEKLFDTNGEWITSRLGIRCRRWARDIATGNVDSSECNSSMAAAAGLAALDNAGLSAEDVDLIIQNTGTPDYATLPPTVAITQEKLNAENCAVLELRSACSGFAHTITTALQFLQNDSCRTVLLISSDLISAHLNLDDPKADRLNAAILADGAGAAVLQKSPARNGSRGILGYTIGSAGVGKKPGVIMEAGGSRLPASEDTVRRGLHYFHQNMNEVLESGTALYVRGAMEVLHASGICLHDLTYIVPHQASAQVADLCSQMFDVPKEKIFMNVDQIGNTGSASVLIALDEMNRGGLLRDGDLIMLVGAEGGKWMYGAVLLRW